MSALFTPAQEARLREIVREEVGQAEPLIVSAGATHAAIASARASHAIRMASAQSLYDPRPPRDDDGEVA